MVAVALCIAGFGNGRTRGNIAGAGRLIVRRSGFKLYECSIDGAFFLVRGGGDGLRKPRRARGGSG